MNCSILKLLRSVLLASVVFSSINPVWSMPPKNGAAHDLDQKKTGGSQKTSAPAPDSDEEDATGGASESDDDEGSQASDAGESINAAVGLEGLNINAADALDHVYDTVLAFFEGLNGPTHEPQPMKYTHANRDLTPVNINTPHDAYRFANSIRRPVGPNGRPFARVVRVSGTESSLFSRDCTHKKTRAPRIRRFITTNLKSARIQMAA